MLFINSIAAIAGPTDVSDLILETPGSGCKSILEHSYLQETGNANPENARNHTVVTSTELAAEACRLAMKRAGVSPKEISLIIGDTTNPKELIPSESHRVAKELDIKVASYDIGTGGVGAPALLSILNAWRPERIQKPILCFTVHTPTLSVPLKNQKSPCVFGDAAFAFLISGTPGGYALEQTYLEAFSATKAVLRTPVNGFITLSDNFLAAIPGLLETLEAGLQLQKTDTVIASTFGVVRLSRFHTPSTEFGESFGATVGMGLEQIDDSLNAQDRVALLVPGCGATIGGCVLKKL